MSSRTTNMVMISALVTTAVAGILWMQTQQQPSRDKSTRNEEKKKSLSMKELKERKTNNKKAEDEKNDKALELPEHLQRKLDKIKRREEKIPFLAAKSPPYDNIFMRDPQGQTLSTISQKKAKWYVDKKKLAKWVTPNTIQLTFEPKARTNDAYHITHKKNVCVACGVDGHVMRHYVVPYAYRSLMPSKYKSHLSHDIVILCPKCHLLCAQAYQERMKYFDDVLRTDPETAVVKIINFELSKIKSAAMALLNHKNKLPQNKTEEYTLLIQNYLKTSSELTTEQLRDAASVEHRAPNPDYIPGAELVVNDLLKNENEEESLSEFVYGWREFFLETVQPRHLPTGWRVDSPVMCSDHKVC
eukprot:CAMPEP_0194179614 /NCGR_PEP_ID=MMETSP0154-20130528/13040_1 /TAXON_ID=1049557 /ORGANISM="Thalassiothrix antarctica, Strain L6-D1" /LENGTH=357 /DNA_ID=CAMNT_0038895023 /DNA_START=12 /DNA_END=1085 /DNA_ORIENTATION=-